MRSNDIEIDNVTSLSVVEESTLIPVPGIQKPFLKWAGGKTKMISDLLK